MNKMNQSTSNANLQMIQSSNTVLFNFIGEHPRSIDLECLYCIEIKPVFHIIFPFEYFQNAL